MGSADKAKSRFWRFITPNSCTQIDVQEQPTDHVAPNIGLPSSINNPIAAHSLGMFPDPRMNNSTQISHIEDSQRSTQVHVPRELQEQKTSKILHVLLEEKLHNPIAAHSLGMFPDPRMNNSTQINHIEDSQRSTQIHVPNGAQESQEQKMRKILHVLLEEKLVKEKIKQILQELMDGMAEQVLLQNGTALSADVMESKVRELEGHLESKEEEIDESLEEDKLQMEVKEVKSKRSASSGLDAIEADGSPSPTMLQEALNDVYKALMECASNLYSELTKHLPAQHPTGPQPLSPSVLFFQQQLCTTFFMGFETLSFNVTQDLDQPGTFEKPTDLKLRLFQEFNDYKALDVLTLLHSKQVLPFQAFMDSKFDQFIFYRDPAPFADASQRCSCLNSMLDSERCPRVYLNFLGLGKATWLLHKLTFALEPTAEIFRVPPSSNYDPEYMKADQDPDSVTKVYFMALPGFTVRNLVFKAHVYLLPDSHH